ncbi:uncharacterized protein LOC107010648 isoform X2 [Solanum pennellii]|uniref:Uncharacterized protein LOC107010648 isoform X2 n=1 Tax=Solanum pennellii TaxID=28526 RepID=A0ABM1V2X7_SOLPN|nr:uncharacterized protein LOC107010648 isoform X2 [Solanum pennellii]
MSASLPKMEALYSKLYSKYAKLKKEKDTSMENLNREQEEKFVNYVAAADAVIDHLRSETDRLKEQVNELRSEMTSMRSANDEEMIQYQKLLMEENLKNKELRDEIQRLQQLDQQGTCFNASNDKGKSRQTITDGDFLPDALDDSTNKKHCRQSLLIVQDTHTPSPMEELPNRPEQPSTCSYKYTKAIFCSLLAVEEMLTFQVIVLLTYLQPCASSKTLFSGLSFSLTLTKNASAEPELVYRVLSLGTFERVAPEWMRDTIMFSPNMCPLFFQRVSRVIKLSY